ncbi:acyltransferase family protein [Streptomyces sp. NPDC053499]|uniref:acyltransferase family protein n=1 Tax=Streptomyces sp. NPDC053499 TaxID=3365707 RepID=UPI0037D4B87A
MAWDPFTDPYVTDPFAAAPSTADSAAPDTPKAATFSAPTVSTVGPLARPGSRTAATGAVSGAGKDVGAPAADSSLARASDLAGASGSAGASGFAETGDFAGASGFGEPSGSAEAPPGARPPRAGLPAPAAAPPSSGTRHPADRRGVPDHPDAAGSRGRRKAARTGAEAPTGARTEACAEAHTGAVTGARTGVRARLRRPQGASALGRTGARDPFLDNARFLLVVLVVLGHNWAPVADAMRGVEAASLLLYSFHLPALALLCGHLSRSFTGRPEQLRRLLSHVLVPYLVFEAAYAGMDTLLWDRPFTVSPTRPAFVCWFLAALFVWRLTAPLWRAVRWPVFFAAVVSVGAGFTDLGEELALPRLLMYWPWFVLGLRLSAEHLRPLRSRSARRWALPVMAAAAAGAWWAAPRVSREWLLMEAGAHELGLRPMLYVGVRLGLFAVGAVLVAAFLALVPAHRTGYTVLGACALYPFLLHGLVVKAVEKAGGYEAVLTGGLLAVVGTTVLAGALAVLLGLPHVRQVLWPLVEPPFPGWLRGRRNANDAAAPGAAASQGTEPDATARGRRAPQGRDEGTASEWPTSEWPASDWLTADWPVSDRPGSDRSQADWPAADWFGEDWRTDDRHPAGPPPAGPPLADRLAADRSGATRSGAEWSGADRFSAADRPGIVPPGTVPPGTASPGTVPHSGDRLPGDRPRSDRPGAGWSAVGGRPAAARAGGAPNGG